MTVRVTTLKGPDAGAYYVEALPNYYLQVKEPRGRWTARATLPLGLSGDVVDDDFLTLMAGRDPRHPNRDRGRRFGDDSVRGYDVTCSAPKPVSVLFGLGPPAIEQRWRLEREAVVDSRPSKASDVDAATLRTEWAARARTLGHEPAPLVRGALSRVRPRPTIESRRLGPPSNERWPRSPKRSRRGDRPSCTARSLPPSPPTSPSTPNGPPVGSTASPTPRPRSDASTSRHRRRRVHCCAGTVVR